MQRTELRREWRKTNLLLRTLSCGLDPVAALDNVCFEAYRSRSPVEFEEKAAGVAQNRSQFISSPQRCG